MKSLDIKKSTEEIRNFYNTSASQRKQAQTYETPHQLERLNKTLEFLINRIQPEWTVLELGCGEGYMTQFISPLCQSVYGVEISDVSLGRAIQLSNVTYHQNDIVNYLDQCHESFDVVIATEVLEHVQDISYVKQKIFDIAKNYVLVSLPVNEEPNYGAFDLNRLGKEISKGDATGHIHHLTDKEIKEWFKNPMDFWTNGIHAIVGGN